jgi:hypothetical protein
MNFYRRPDNFLSQFIAHFFLLKLAALA